MDKFIIQEIFNKVDHKDRIKMNDIISLYGDLFEGVYELIAEDYFTDDDISL